MVRLPLACLTLVLMAGAISGCTVAEPPVAASGSRAIGGTITVFAAASLTEAFEEIALDFERRYAGTDVRFNYGGSPALRFQLEQGARADVFASADAGQMELARKAGVVAGPGKVFARNSLVLITPAGNPAGLAGPADLARPGIKLVLANEEVPVGVYTRQMLATMAQDPALGSTFAGRVLKNVVSLESNVKQVVAKVQLGEADAGVAYLSDVTAEVSPALQAIAIPARFNVLAEYPIAVVNGGPNPDGAAAFIDYVLSPSGQNVLARHNFTSVN